MDLNSIQAPPQTAKNHHISNGTNTTDFDEALENLLRLDISDFDFSLFEDVTLPPPSLPLVTGEMPIDPTLAPVVPPQLSRFFNEMNSALAACGGNGGGERVLEHHRDKNRVCFVARSSAPSAFKKRAVIPPEKLAELEISDPKKAKRIINNRNAAKRSKEKKRNYEKELKKRVKLLQIKADSVTAECLMAMNEVMQLAAEYKRVKDLIQATLLHQEKQRAFIESMKEEEKILTMEIHELKTAMADPSFGEPVSQSLLEVPHQPELHIPMPHPPLVPPPPSSFGEPLIPHPPSPFCEPLLPPPLSPFGEPLVPPPPFLFGESLVPPPLSSFGEHLVPPPPFLFGEPLLPSPPSPFGEPLIPPPLSPFGEPLVPPPPFSFGEPLVPPSLSPFGEPLVPPPPFSFGEPLIPHPPFSLGEPLVPSPPCSFGEPLVTLTPSSFDDPLVPPQLSPFGEPLAPPQPSRFRDPFSDHFFGTSFSSMFFRVGDKHHQ